MMAAENLILPRFITIQNRVSDGPWSAYCCNIAIVLKSPPMAVPRPYSHLQVVQIRNAFLHHVQFHLDEVILNAASPGCRENLLPVQGIFSNRDDLLLRCRPSLHVHRNEAARILIEIFGGVEALANGGDLELKLYEFGIEKFEENVIRAFAVYRGRLKLFVMQTLLDAGLSRLLAHFVVLVGGAFHVVHGRLFRPAEAGDEHLRSEEHT